MLGFALDISYLHLNFEVAAHEAACHFWPNVVLKACQFHLCEAWWRKIQTLGLFAVYKKILRCSTVIFLFWFMFLKPEKVEQNLYFQKLRIMTKLFTLPITLSILILPTPHIWTDPVIASKRTTN